jgi:uncharacterized delta-60 repeat protein
MNALSRLLSRFIFVRCLALLGLMLPLMTMAESPAGQFNGPAGVNTAPTFTGRPGKLLTDFTTTPPQYDYQTSVAIQNDERILVAGSSDYAIALARYNADGSLDTSFGGGGKITTDRESGNQGKSVVLQTDGKILVAGTSGLIRYNTDGSIDASFGVNGRTSGSYYSVALQMNGNVLVEGDKGLSRYNVNGTLDTTFGNAGTVANALVAFSDDSGHMVTVQLDGKILLAGSIRRLSYYDFSLARFDSNGSLDPSFGVAGIVTTTFSGWDFAHGITLQSDGKILVAGRSNSVIALARYNVDGSLDTGFHGDGKLTTSVDTEAFAHGITLQSDGKILVAGSTRAGSGYDWNFLVVRYNTDGSLDATFDYDGKVITDFGGGDFGYSIAVQSDGKILVTGRGGERNSFALARLNTDGSLDTTFAPPVNTLHASPAYTEQYPSIVLDANVQILDAELSAANSYDGATLTLARHNGAKNQDVFSARTGGTLTLLQTGSYFAVDNVTVGRVTTNGAGALVLTFSANATESLVTKAMKQIAYANTSDAPPANVQIDWTFNDGNTGAQGTGGALSVTGSTIVQITPVNDYPVLTVPLPDISVQATQTLTYIIPTTTFSDPEGESLSYTVEMANGTGVPPWLGFNSSTKTLSGAPGLSDIGVFTIIIRATDSGGLSATATVLVTVSLPAPVVSLTPTSIIFADQNVNTSSPAQTVTLTNTGGAAMGITSIQSSINVFAVTHSCGSSLAVHASCTLYVTFAPLVIGNRTGAITITSNPTNSLLLAVSGTGAANAPSCTLSAMPAHIPPTGRSSTLTPTCTPAATSYSWTGGTCQGTTASTCTVTPTMTTPYSVTGTNSYGSSTASATVTVKSVDLTPILMLLLDEN